MEINRGLLASILTESATQDAMKALREKVGTNQYKKSGENIFDVSRDAMAERDDDDDIAEDVLASIPSLDAEVEPLIPDENMLIADGTIPDASEVTEDEENDEDIAETEEKLNAALEGLPSPDELFG